MAVCRLEGLQHRPPRYPAGGAAMKCGNYAGIGSKCVEEAGHEGPHKSVHGFQWTDESDAAARAAILKSLGGKTE